MGRVDVGRMLSALGALSEATTTESMAAAAAAAAASVAGADSAVATLVGSGPPTVGWWPDAFLSAESNRVFEHIMRTEPWPLATHTRRGAARPLRISDVLSQRDYRRRAIYCELFRGLEVERQAAFAVPIDAGRCLCIAVDRNGRDFSSDDLDRLEALRRPLSAEARRAVARPPAVPAATGAGLTPREAGVLALVASGLANDEVGRRLGISARTVNKHLEHVYTKLGARNRTEAAARWRDGSPPAGGPGPGGCGM